MAVAPLSYDDARCVKTGLHPTSCQECLQCDGGWWFEITDQATGEILARGWRHQFRDALLGIPQPVEDVAWGVRWNHWGSF